MKKKSNLFFPFNTKRESKIFHGETYQKN